MAMHDEQDAQWRLVHAFVLDGQGSTRPIARRSGTPCSSPPTATYPGSCPAVAQPAGLFRYLRRL
nr:hypothetical protein [Gammaproteobacteria bacterium]